MRDNNRYTNKFIHLIWIAIENGNLKGKKIKEIIESSMSRSEKVESDELVEEWLRNHKN